MPSGTFVDALARARVMAIIRGTDGEAAVATLDDTTLELKLEGYGFRWFRASPPERTSAP